MKTSLLFVLFFLVSCGKNTSGKQNGSPLVPDPLTNPMMCGQFSDCSAPVDWSISSRTRSFPRNFSIKVDDVLLIDTCGTGRVAVERTLDQKVLFKANFLPSRDFGLEITDRGHCDNNALFFSGHIAFHGENPNLQNQPRNSLKVNIHLED